MNRLVSRSNKFLLALVVFGASALCAVGQQQYPSQQPTQTAQPRRTAPPSDVPAISEPVMSDLTRENLERVAASPAQVKAVLAKDPGIMVELKRWVARDASENGQLISDDDLTDDAIFLRLNTDVKFRSVATRLVQKYGYLRPGIDPESAMGRQEEFVLKERARKFVEFETQTEQEDLQQQKETRRNAQEYAACQQQQTTGYGPTQTSTGAPLDCSKFFNNTPNGQFGAPAGNGPRNEQQNVLPEQNAPSNSGASSIMRAQLGVGDNSPSGLIDSGSATLQSISDPASLGLKGGSGTDSLIANSNPSDQLDMNALDPSRSPQWQAMGSNPQDLAALNGNSESNGRNDLSGNYNPAIYRYSPSSKNREVNPTDVVHRPSPYADIPSLYDLYVQAPSRNGTPQRFGSQVFRDGLRNLRAIPMDLPVGPDYVVGPGDSLSIDMWGGVSTRLVRVVDREGRVSLPEAGPVQVSGRSLGDVQQLVQHALSSQFRDTSADVSVARLRTVRVYVVGEVSDPGAYDISSLSTPLNALVSAGGVSQHGSLRLLKHYHGKDLVDTVDAYDLLLRGVTPDAKKLDNGDTLLVPPVGPQVTITGMVRRPAIYELRNEKTLAEALDLAGGILPAATLKHVEVQRLEAHEKRTMLSLDLSAENGTSPELGKFEIKDGDEIHIFPIAPYNQDTIYLQGHVLRPGKYSYREGMKVTDIITSYKDLLPEPAAHYGEIIRLNAPDFRPTVVSFDLESAMKDPSSAPPLQPLDTVRVFSRFDFEPAPVVSVGGDVRSPGTYRTSGQPSLRDAIFLAGGLGPTASLDSAQVFRINADGTSKIFSVNLREAMAGNPADNILLQPRDHLLIHKSIFRVDVTTVEITGEVAKPGRYPYTGNMHAADLIQAAGGLKRSADNNTADLTRYAASSGIGTHEAISLASLTSGNSSADIPLNGGDVLAIRQKTGWKDVGAFVKVGGEVQHPSGYGIQPGERLSSVLERAGGFTADAYPYGALLTRRDVRDIELKAQIELIARIKSERVQLKSLPETTPDEKNEKMNAIAQTDSTIGQLSTKEPVGRVVIHIKKDLRDWKGTDADVVLKDGDELYIPKNPGTVLLTGQVFNPTAVTVIPGRSARWYLSQAGGLTPMADKKAVFVIRGDGSVISAKNNGSGWGFNDGMGQALRPGDTVVVPERAPKVGGTNWQAVIQAGQLASSVALAVAYIHP